jgi:CHAD domain-containing protein
MTYLYRYQWNSTLIMIVNDLFYYNTKLCRREIEHETANRNDEIDGRKFQWNNFLRRIRQGNVHVRTDNSHDLRKKVRTHVHMDFCTSVVRNFYV